MEIVEALSDAEPERDILALERDQFVGELDKKIATIDEEIKGLKLAISRHNGEGGQIEDVRKDWNTLKRSDAVWDILTTTKRGLSPKDIAALLGEVGRDDEPLDVSQTLQYLKRRGNVRSLGRGKWIVTEPAEMTEDELIAQGRR